jgi:hypothetical protein
MENKSNLFFKTDHPKKLLTVFHSAPGEEFCFLLPATLQVNVLNFLSLTTE